MGLIAGTDSLTPVISVEEMKAHARIDGDAEDALLSGFVAAATDFLERECRIAIAVNEFRLSLDGFPAERHLVLPKPPLQSVDRIQYTDAAGVEQTLAAGTYIVDADSRPARIVLKPGQSWPATDGSANCVRVEFTAGF